MKCEYLLVVLSRQLSNPTSSLKRALAAYRNIDLSRPAPKRAPCQATRIIHRLTAHEIEEVVAGYQAGSSIRELGTRFRVSSYAISRNLKIRGVRLRRTPMSVSEINEASALYDSGLSLARVSSRLGYPTTTVHLALRTAGVPMRDPHGRER